MSKLNPNAQKWVDALRSGKYEQCQGRLGDEDSGYLSGQELCMTEWISVKDRLPENLVRVIAAVVKPRARWSQEAMYSAGEWTYGTTFKQLEGVTHWMPLPEPPK